jgi:hypothetical protein
LEFRGNSANLKPIPAEVWKYEVKIPEEFHPDGIPWASSFPLTISTNPSKHSGHKASDEIFKRVRLRIWMRGRGAMFRLGGPQNSVGTEFRQNILLLHVHTSVGIAIKFRGIPTRKFYGIPQYSADPVIL